MGMESGINADQNFYSRRPLPLQQQSADQIHSYDQQEQPIQEAKHQQFPPFHSIALITPDPTASPHRQATYSPPSLAHFNSTSPQTQLLPNLPYLTTANLQAVNANGFESGLTDGGDPAEFYREYRGVQQSANGYTEITSSSMSSIAPEARPMPSSLRLNGNGTTTAKHPSVPARNVKPSSYRSASSPLDNRMVLNSTKSSTALNGLAKSNQPSVKDLLKRFDANNEHTTTSVPARKPPSRGTSREGVSASLAYPRDRTDYMGRTASNLQSTSSTSTSFARPGLSTRDNGVGRRSPEKSRPSQRTRFAPEDQLSNNTLSGVPRVARPRTSLPVHNPQASKSMTNLSPTSPGSAAPPQTITRRPLFGEVIPVGPGSDNIGYGIPQQQHIASRRTSDPNLHQNSLHQRSRSDVDVSPSSPTAWYLGVTPTLGDVNHKKSSNSLGHNRNHSDFQDKKVNMMNGVTPSFHAQPLTPPVQSPTTSQRSPINSRSTSRLPISTKRLSNSSASESSSQASRANSPFSAKRISNGKMRKPEQRPWTPAGRSATPSSITKIPSQRSPRGRGKNAETPSNGSLNAYISAPAPKASPPLRSSRPRQTVASASSTPIKSRAPDRTFSAAQIGSSMKVTRNSGFEDPRPRKIPDLGPVDFAARRAKIQRAYTKSIHEVEQKEIRAANMRRLNERQVKDKAAKAQREAEEQEQEQAQALQSEQALQNQQEIPAMPVEYPSEAQLSPPPLQIKTSFSKPEPLFHGNAFTMEQDSPTLGLPGSYVEDEPASAISNATGITEIENEPQTEAARLGRMPSVRPRESSNLSSQVMFTSDDLSPEQAMYGFNQERESIDIMLATTPTEEPRSLASREIDIPEVDSAAQAISEADTHVQHHDLPMLTAAVYTVSPAEAPLNYSQPPTSIDICPDMEASKCESFIEPDDQFSPATEIASPEIHCHSFEPSYTVSPGTPDAPHLDLPTLRTALAPPSVAINEADRDYLNTPVTDMEDEGLEGLGVSGLGEQRLYDSSHDDTQESQTTTQIYRRSHQSSWTDYSVDSAREYPSQDENSKPASVVFSSEPEVTLQAFPAERSAFPAERPASPTPPVPPKPDGYSPMPSPRFGAHSPQIPSPTSHQLPPLATGNSFTSVFSERTRFSATSGPLWPEYSPPLPPVPAPVEPSPIPPTRAPPLPNFQMKRPPSSVAHSSYNGGASNLEFRRESDDIYSSRASISTPRSSTQISFDEIEVARSSNIYPPIPQTEEQKEAAEKLKKRLSKRRHIVKEIIDTEAVYLKDMNVVEEIYKGTAEACPKLDAGDVKVIFRNTNEIVTFTTSLLDDLKLAAASIYSPRAQKPRHSKTTISPGTEDRFSLAVTLNEEQLTDEQKDLRTFVGASFGKNLKRMQVVYTDFLKNSEAASARLSILQTDSSVKVWLDECDTVAKDLTQAWDLDALLVKPVQRITRYQLLFKELVDITQDDHPDAAAISLAHRELKALLKTIDDMKKRIQMVGKIVSTRKRKDSDVRSGLAKAFGRVKEKSNDKHQINSKFLDDDVYTKLHEKYGDDYLRLQVVLRDVEFYTRQVALWVKDFLTFLSAMEVVMKNSPEEYKELESKWTQYNKSMRSIGTVALEEHVNGIQLRVIDPFEKVIQAYGPPGLAMKKRGKRRIDFEKFMVSKVAGAKLNEKDAGKIDEYEALNETLKIELPQLSALTEKIGNICLSSLVMMQVEWFDIWQKKVKSVLEENQIPQEISDIVNTFHRDFSYQSNAAKEIGIVNNHFPSGNFPLGGQIVDSEKKDRPSNLSTTTTRSRGLSVNGDRTPSLPTPDFAKRLSGQFVMSPINPTTPTIPQFAYSQPYTASHSRAGSGSPATPDGTPRPSVSSLVRPNTGRSYTSEGGNMQRESIPRASNDYNSGYRRESGSTYNSHHIDGPPVSSRPYSGVFHSAMPMPDGTEDSQRSSRNSSRDRNMSGGYNVLYLAASLFEFNISATKSEAGYPYLTYQAGEIFDVIGEKGELWLAKNQDDPKDQVGWIWSKHFARLATD